METINTLGTGTPQATRALNTQNSEQYVPLETVDSASRNKVLDEAEPVILSAEESTKENKDLIDTGDRSDTVTITDEDKANFIDSVVRGTRFYSDVFIFGGNVKVRLRSRTLSETEAIMSYINRKGLLGELVTRADVHDTILAALLVAQVDEVGGVKYREMQPPYKYVESASSSEDPGWLSDMEMWKNKPEHLTAALGEAVLDFEAKYWKMIAASKDENFWNPGKSID